ncbi:hypothetical protein [Capillimicrobium parvum]|uniref:Tol-Pal system protein TolB n=1 Tax=Capillimicrobium parvum TaxID=2884022 RepID=A0A9E6Y291_9ACTN|nr:hypothetical protein [Capillimicrobium parvum]UGS38091.1 Tol-Pal system protein TolB [Capillimicrobium parvum]
MSRTTSLLVAALALALIVPAGASATFPGTNGKIAFAGTKAGSSCSGPGCLAPEQLFSVSADGSGLKALTSTAFGSGQSPAWSPSGRLAYVSRGQVLVRSAALGRAKPVTLRGVRSQSVDNLAWAADGSELYVRAIASSGGATAFLLAGGKLPTAKVLLRATDVQDIAAAPNGRQVAFVNSGALYVADANGTSATTVATGVNSIDWSPDSTRLVTVLNGAIVTMSPTGANRTQVTQPPSAATGWNGAAMPSFTPDGSSIVFLLIGSNPDPTPAEVQAAQSSHGLATISTTGTNQQLLVPASTVSPNLADGPVMQPVG